METNLIYAPDIFRRDNIEEAKAIILTPEIGLTTNERWKRETEHLSELIQWPEDTRLVIDYGCGIGRMMRDTPPSVLGVDISPTMRAQGEAYVDRESCGFVSPVCFELLIMCGLRAQGAMAIWALQHVLYPDDVIRSIFNALLPGAPLFVVNHDQRFVPARGGGRSGWIHDGVNIWAELESGGFVLVQEEPMPETLCQPGSWFKKYERAKI